jgi:DNA-binding transcriptional MerR regulator
MKYLLMGAAVLALFAMAGPASALTVDEITRLKKAGVSDAVIQKMLEQEAAGVKNQGPMVETDQRGHLQRRRQCEGRIPA